MTILIRCWQILVSHPLPHQCMRLPVLHRHGFRTAPRRHPSARSPSPAAQMPTQQPSECRYARAHPPLCPRADCFIARAFRSQPSLQQVRLPRATLHRTSVDGRCRLHVRTLNAGSRAQAHCQRRAPTCARHRARPNRRFFRNFMPDAKKLGAKLRHRDGHCAYACQCTWASLELGDPVPREKWFSCR